MALRKYIIMQRFVKPIGETLPIIGWVEGESVIDAKEEAVRIFGYDADRFMTQTWSKSSITERKEAEAKLEEFLEVVS